MKLNDYLQAERGRARRIAEAVNKSPAFVYQMGGGKRPVPVPLAKRIVQATGGVVTLQELRPDDWQLIWPELVGAAGAPQPAEEAVAQ